jgi:hypothetical protein
MSTVECRTKSGERLLLFSTPEAAVKTLKLRPSQVNYVLQGKRQTTMNLVFRYVQDPCPEYSKEEMNMALVKINRIMDGKSLDSSDSEDDSSASQVAEVIESDLESFSESGRNTRSHAGTYDVFFSDCNVRL